MAPSAGAAAYIYHHVALPPRLPQEDDSDVGHEYALLEVVIQALETFQRYVKSEHTGPVMSAIATVENLKSSQDNYGNVSEVQLQTLLSKLTSGGTIGAVPLHINEQNAGILVSRFGGGLNFEFFELSPENKAVMASGRLIRTFPAYATRMNVAEISGGGLRKSISETIAKMTTQPAPGFQPQVRKNNIMMDEERDTTHPGMVTDFLVNVTAGWGDPTSVKRITKHTREEVLWNDALIPWRRSPLWLLLRVSLQLLFTRKTPDTLHPDSLYKAFMVFMLSRLLDLAKKDWIELGSEAVHIISAKLTRRLRKFELLKQNNCLQSSWEQYVQARVISAHDSIKQHWQQLVDNTQANIDTTAVRNLQPEQDLNMYLLDLDAFLSQVASRQRDAASCTFTPTSKYPVYDAAELPKDLVDHEEYKHFRLAAFEKWVEYHLADWIEYHLYDADACEKLRTLMDCYYILAVIAYAHIPVSLSIMYLTLAELWIACDRCACAIYPMLAEYDCEVRVTEFQCLLLPQKSHLMRLNAVECYVQSRQDQATHGRPSIFREFGDSWSFAVRYFDQSDQLQATLSKIEGDAAAKRKQKCEELESKKVQYKQYMDLSDNAECEYYTAHVGRGRNRREELRHSGTCGKCADRKRAQALNIDIYEWPVSSIPSHAKATVFELCIPEAFGNWRDASAYFINTVLGYQEPKPLKPRCHFTLSNHHWLTHMLSSQYFQRRVIPLSEVKSHTVTHRKNQTAIPHLKDEDVCLENALQYAYYDNTQGTLNSVMPRPTGEISKKCSYRMPQRAEALEPYMYHSALKPDGLPPNEVIAGLSDCPAHFSIDEYKGLGSLPLGHNIVYSNILAQLAIPSVDLKKIETQILVLQTVQQVGPPSQSIARASHSILTDAGFGHAMLEQLEIALRHVEKNWESWRAAMIFSLLSRRVLSFTSSLDVRLRALRYLIELRRVCLTWLVNLKLRAAASLDDDERTELFSRATEVALLCISTYDVEDADFRTILDHESATSTLIQSSIIVQENHGSVLSECMDLFRSTFESSKSLMYRILPTLRDNILLDSSGLSEAVTANWAAFQPGSTGVWASLNGSQEHWLQVTSGSLLVHFNLLTGELLVNGLPLARLPSQYMNHCMYALLFGRSALEVVPSDQNGLAFSAKSPYHDYELHFNMAGPDMLLVAIGAATKLDLLPSRVLQNQLPHAFLADYVHWYDHGTDEVLFRHRDTPWQSAVEDWRLIHDKFSKRWRLVKGSSILVDMGSRSASLLSKLFQPLEDARHIHVKLDMTTRTIDVRLPRLQLGFYIEAGDEEVHSRQHRGMVIDRNQSIGALVGLVSKLTLRHEHTMERLVLIPVPRSYDSSITHKKYPGHDHVLVTINKEEATKVYAFTLDEDLGRMLDSSELQSRLLLSYLHAVTSGVLPDPLTHRTGVESSLEILQSSAVRSFDVLTQQNIALLNRISCLSAERSFYPQILKEMQNIVWDYDLPSLSQHPGFRVLVSSLYHQATKMRVFHPDNDVFDLIDQSQLHIGKLTNAYLDQRDMIRSSTFRIAGYGGEGFTTSQDRVYNARDREKDSERGLRAFMTAKMMVRGTACLHSRIQELNRNLLRAHFDNATVKGVDSSFDCCDLRFDSKWLEKPTPYLAKLWCTLHQGLANATASCNHYDLATWLCTMSYAPAADMEAIQTLAMFFRSQEFSAILPPAASAFELSEGSTWEPSEIRKILQDSAKTFESSAEAQLPKHNNETDAQHEDRIYFLFENRRDAIIKEIKNALYLQWPMRTPAVPSSTNYDVYLNMSTAVTQIQKRFQIWFDNRQFREYLEKLSVVVRRQTVSAIPGPRYFLILPIDQEELSDKVRTYTTQDIFNAEPPSMARKLPLGASTDDNVGFLSLKPPSEPDVLTDQHFSARTLSVRDRLQLLCSRLAEYATSKCERDYVQDLRSSCTALEEHNRINQSHTQKSLIDGARDLLQEYLRSCKKFFDAFNLALEDAVEDGCLFSNKLDMSVQHSPRMSPTFWLSQLHRTRFDKLSFDWKEMIVEYGKAITSLQRAQRLVRLSNKTVDLIEELGHVGHVNWDPYDNSETLLMEAESGIMVREEQEYIFKQMRSPEDGQNIVLQLLMGGGKSTVIVPAMSVFLSGDKTK